MAKKAGGRLISSAGLVNYYDSEDKRAIHISPVSVIVVTVAISVLILALDLISSEQPVDNPAPFLGYRDPSTTIFFDTAGFQNEG